MKQKLWSSYQLALRSLVKNKKLSFVEAAKRVAEARKRHSEQVEEFRRRLFGTPKMRMLAERKMLEDMRSELQSLKSIVEKDVDTILRIGLLEQHIHDYEESYKHAKIKR